jgi:acyl carrier protein
MPRKDEVLAIIYAAMESLNEEVSDDEKIPLQPDTKLFGAEATIDSLSLVSVIVDVESQASEVLGFPVVLTDDRAIGQEVSPFTDPEALSNYILMLASENA